MAFNVENASGANLSIDDLGITLSTSEIIDLSVQGSFDTIVGSIQVGEEISQLIQAGDLIVKDPNDGVTNLSIADGIACARALGDPNYRVGAGAILGDISDIVLSTPSNTEVLTYDSGSGTWINAAGGSGSGGFSGLGIWRYRTATTSTPASGQLQFDNVTIDSATELYVSELNDAGTDMSAFLSLVTSGSLLYIQLQGDSTQFVVVEVGTSSVLSGVYTFPLTNVEAQGTAPANNAQVALVVAGAGSGGGGGDPDQNLWETITSDAGSAVANTTTDTLTIAGGTGISTAVAGDTLTITNDSPNVDQNIWETITSDAGSAVANTTTDTLTIAGGTGISTAISGDTLTITATGSADQNLWETITSDSGSTVANTTTDTLTIAGGTGISTAIVGDTITISAGVVGPAQLVSETVEFIAATAVVIPAVDTYVDVPGATLDITTTDTGHIWATAQFNGLSPPGNTVFSARIMIDGVGGPDILMRLEAGNKRDNHVMARTDTPLVAGTYTVKVQLENTEDAGDATVEQFAMYAESLGVPAGPNGVDGTDGTDGVDGADGVDGDDGAPGAAGPPGSGTTINVYDEGIIVPNSPFSELNFIGATIAATDAGSGRTDITVTAGTDELVKISANDTTAGFLGVKIVGVTDETAITELNDGADEDLEIGLADNLILPGIESVTVPSGTLLERPGSPAAGMMRFNDTTNLMEYYNGTIWVSIIGNSTGPGTLAGSIVGYHFLLDKFAYGSWLGTTTKHITSDSVQYIMPFNAEIVAITYGCDIINSDIQLDIEIAADGDGATNSTAYTWVVNDARVARISTPTGAGGPGGIALTAGTKIGVFGDNPGGGTAPNDVVVSVYIQWTDEIEEIDIENYAGNFT